MCLKCHHELYAQLATEYTAAQGRQEGDNGMTFYDDQYDEHEDADKDGTDEPDTLGLFEVAMEFERLANLGAREEAWDAS
jgi:hypothetical protein